MLDLTKKVKILTDLFYRKIKVKEEKNTISFSGRTFEDPITFKDVGNYYYYCSKVDSADKNYYQTLSSIDNLYEELFEKLKEFPKKQ